MKILVFDSWNGKFSRQLIDHWTAIGHEVVFNGSYDEKADIAFWYQADNACVEGVNKVDVARKYVQFVDIEVWAGQASAVPWENVNGAIYMAKHIGEIVDTKGIPTRMIKPGIDLNKFTLKEPQEETPVRRIAYVVGNGRIWDVKRLDIALQILYDIRKLKPEYIWQLHIRGTYSSHEQYNAYCRHLQKDLKLDDFVIWHEDRVEDMNQWLEDKDYFLLPSIKEAFSFATAEAMAKGIKPIINNWQSAKETWGKFVCNSYLEMLERLCEDTYEPIEYRKYIEDNYSQERYFKEIDNFVLEGGETIMSIWDDTPVEQPEQKIEETGFKGLPVRAGDDKIWLLKGGKKRWVTTAEAYEKIGFKFGDEREIDKETLDVIPEGEPIS